MAKLEQIIAAAREREPETRPNQTVSRERIEKRVRYRRQLRIAGASTVVAVTTVLVLVFGVFQTEDRSGDLVFPDGSTASFGTVPPQISLAEATDKHIVVALERGSATFHVTKKPERKFEVRSGETTVLVTGTQFTVSRDASATTVSLIEGSVLVKHRNTNRVLEMGGDTTVTYLNTPPEKPVLPEIASFKSEPENEENEMLFESVSTSEKANSRLELDKKRVLNANTIENIIDSRPKAEAANEIQAGRVADEVEALFVASEAMVRVGRTRAAIGYLKRISKHHRHDKRRGLAEFTAGNLWLNKLSNPRRAVRHYTNVPTSSPVFEESLAKTAVAWRKAGKHEKAERVVVRYNERFPNGAYRKLLNAVD